MSTIIMNIVFALNFLVGHNHAQAYKQTTVGTYTSAQQSIVIIDGDELGAKKH